MNGPLFLVLALLLLASPTNGQQESPLSAVVNSELAFAKMGREKGIKASFVAFFADSSIVFRQKPVNGKAWYEKIPESPALLLWYPSFADVAASGDWGYSTGPSEYRAKGKDDPQVNYGFFASIWKKQSDGSWKVFMDFGTSTPVPSTKPPVFSAAGATLRKSAGPTNHTVEKAGLLKTDRDFAASSASGGLVSAYQLFSAPTIRYMRRQHFPALGNDSALAAVKASGGVATWNAMEGDIASSADLGLTYGHYEWKKNATDDKPSETGYYAKFWKKQPDGAWKIVLDALLPTPPVPPKPSN